MPKICGTGGCPLNPQGEMNVAWRHKWGGSVCHMMLWTTVVYPHSTVNMNWSISTVQFCKALTMVCDSLTTSSPPPPPRSPPLLPLLLLLLLILLRLTKSSVFVMKHDFSEAWRRKQRRLPKRHVPLKNQAMDNVQTKRGCIASVLNLKDRDQNKALWV